MNIIELEELLDHNKQ